MICANPGDAVAGVKKLFEINKLYKFLENSGSFNGFLRCQTAVQNG